MLQKKKKSTAYVIGSRWELLSTYGQEVTVLLRPEGRSGGSEPCLSGPLPIAYESWGQLAKGTASTITLR